MQTRGWRLQGNSWRLGNLLHRAPGGGSGLESSWRALGGLHSRLGGSWRALGASWVRWGRSWRRLGRCWGHIKMSWRLPGPSWSRLGNSGSHVGAIWRPKGAQNRAQKGPNRAPEATRAENGEHLIFYDSTKDFNDFSCLRVPFWR